MSRISGTNISSIVQGEVVRAFDPHRLPPSQPGLAAQSYEEWNRAAEMALRSCSLERVALTNSRAICVARKTGSAVRAPATPCLCLHHQA